MSSVYQSRMLGYYPDVIQRIKEFKGIITGESPEFEGLETDRESVLNDAYLLTMGEERVKQWETVLGIAPLQGSSVADRRDTIVARIRGQGKLNTALINAIVKTFTGGTANSWIKDSILYIEITPPPGNKSYQFPNIEQEIKKKIPAHLGFKLERNYNEWLDIKTNYETWQDVLDNFEDWEDVILRATFE